MIKPPVGFVSAGGFRRLPLHVGAKYRYFLAEKEGRVPHPFFMCGSSAGAISDVACLPWTDENFKKVAHTIINLRQKDMFDLPAEVKMVAGFSIAESFLGFVHVLCPNLSQRAKLGIEAGRTLLSLGAKVAPLYELFLRQPSLYSNAPLRRFLKSPRKGIDFKGIWESDIHLEIPAVDILTGEEYIFSLDHNRHRPDRDERLISALLASSSLPAHFPLEKLDGHLLDDAAILNSIPVHRAIAAGCQNIFVLLYSNNGTSPTVENWVDELTRALDISMGEIIRLNLSWHISINQDLLALRQIEQEIFALEQTLHKFDELAVVPEQENAKGLLKEAFREKIEKLRAKLNTFSFTSKEVTTIIPVMSDAPIPEQYFRQFKRELMEEALNLGYAAMEKTLKDLEK